MSALSLPIFLFHISSPMRPPNPSSTNSHVVSMPTKRLARLLKFVSHIGTWAPLSPTACARSLASFTPSQPNLRNIRYTSSGLGMRRSLLTRPMQSNNSSWNFCRRVSWTIMLQRRWSIFWRKLRNEQIEMSNTYDCIRSHRRDVQ